jgi:hypothetical protein
VIEAFGRRVGLIPTCVQKNDVGMKIENLHTGSIERQPIDFESSRSGHNVEMIAIICGNLHNLVVLPAGAQPSDERQVVAAIVFET